MALQATFVADFASFYDAVQKAEVQLKGLDTGVGKVESTLNRMVDNFSGRKIIQEATLMAEAIDRSGGVSRLTSAEILRFGGRAEEAAEKMKLLGLEVPKNVQHLADLASESRNAASQGSIFDATWTKMASSFAAASLIERGATALFDLGSESIRTGARIGDLADRNKLSTNTIQEMMHVADQTGSSLEGMAKSAYNLGIRVAGGSGSVREAVSDLGLEFEALRSMPLEQKFATVVKALEGVHDENERNRLGAVLMGQSFVEMAAAVSQGYSDIAAAAPKMAESTVRAAQEFDDAWSNAKATVKAMVAELGVLADYKGAKEAMENYRKLAVQLGLVAAETKTYTDIVLDAEPAKKKWSDRLRDVESRVAALTAADLKQIEAARSLGATNKELTDEFGLTAHHLRVLDELQRRDAQAKTEMQAAANRLRDAEMEIRSAGEGWRGTLAGINEETVKAVRAYLEAGVAQSTLATKYELTATQVKAVATALAEEKRAHEEAAREAERAERIKAQAIQQTSKLWNEYHALLVERTGTSTDVQIAAVQRWAADVADQAKRAGTWNLEMMVALESTTRAKLENMKVDWSALRDHSRARLDETAEKARATYEAMLARSNEFTLGTLEDFRRQAEAAEAAAANWNASYSTTIDAISAKSSEGTSKIVRDAEQVALSWNQAMELVRKGMGTMSGSVPQGFTYGNGAGFQPIKSDTLGPLLNTTMPAFPSFATGVTNFGGGIAKVHKDELLVNLPKGTDVIPAISPYPPGGRGAASNITVNVTAGMGANGSEIAMFVKKAIAEHEAKMGRRVGG